MENLLECPICMVKYDERQRVPRALPCQHVICSECLCEIKSISPSLNFNCPVCRHQITSSLNEIPKSLVILQLIELNKNNQSSNQNLNQNSSILNRLPPVIPRPVLPPPVIPPRPAQLAPTAPTTPLKPTQTWNLKDYMRSIFNEIDVNKDGSISSNELQHVLKNVQSNAAFDPKTVYLLIKKYDRNGDNEINFEEFYDLYNNLNEEFETFLMTDADGSGSIDQNEFAELLKLKGYQFSRDFFEWFFREMVRFSQKYTIEFDIYIRIATRLDYLAKHYYSNSYYNKNFSAEQYFSKTFFQEFW